MLRSVLLLLSAAVLFLAGCATTALPTPYWTIHETAFTTLKPGSSTKEDVLRQVGRPLYESYFPRQKQEVWDYRYLDHATVMLAYVYFDSKGVYQSVSQMMDPAFYAAGDW